MAPTKQPFLVLPQPWPFLLLARAVSVRLQDGMPWQGRGVTCFVASTEEVLPAEQLHNVRMWAREVARVDLPRRDDFRTGEVVGWASLEVAEGRPPAGWAPAFSPGPWAVRVAGDASRYAPGSWRLPSRPAPGWHRFFAAPPVQAEQLSLL